MSLIRFVKYSLTNFQNGKLQKLFVNELHAGPYYSVLKDRNKLDNLNSSRTSDEDKKVDFGFQTVSATEKAQKVHQVFENVASKYDLMNDVMSVGIHRIWKDYFVKKMFPLRPGTNIIDVAGGTGDIAFRMLQAIERQNKKYNSSADGAIGSRKNTTILISDINQAMLDVGKKRALKMNLQSDDLSWLCANAQELPLSENSFDLYTIAFGIRNVIDVSKALDEAYRVLRPGGRFMCLEFSHVKNPLLKWMYDTYSLQVIPPLGEVVAGDWKSYQYLVESIRKFPTQDDFKNMIEEAGFRSVCYENLTFGVVSIHSGYKI
ncbi:2-methoxy-6-polyprenyl-1,4-benzoquinol methylase, mitochondrial-like [Daphnia carinata]|uniref:2-methoxy-6-polyprenyl-1,4-benzoquinol methylase, mitochondrial-like n=1 Tax=Daphnia carinata TaxID=120202 RepID=UPI00257F76C9|nr:2-methoxy-6-polyprenyl-1,4-benzoquinol methylase, mitochondrial-like [Daphnia carinata]